MVEALWQCLAPRYQQVACSTCYALAEHNALSFGINVPAAIMEEQMYPVTALYAKAYAPTVS